MTTAPYEIEISEADDGTTVPAEKHLDTRGRGRGREALGEEDGRGGGPVWYRHEGAASACARP